MAITLQNADNALKSVYLDVISEQLNNSINPFLSAIEKTTNDVWGKDVRKLSIHGLNGGIGAGTEDGDLPSSSSNGYGQIVSTLKNLYGVIEISDKAIRASENNAGAFVSLLDSEMEGLIKSSRFNFGRMLFGDGTGVIAKVSSVLDGIVMLDTTRNLMEGMIVDFRDKSGNIIAGGEGRKISHVDAANSAIMITGTMPTQSVFPSGTLISVQGSYNNEITGIGAIFDLDKEEIYGANKTDNHWLNPNYMFDAGELTENKLQTMLDNIEEQSGGSVNYITCSWGVRRALLNMFADKKRSLDTMELAGGFKGLSYNGIPIVVDRFCPKNTMYLLNTNDFAIHQLCDWQWLSDDDGRVLKQVPGKAVYTATLVKYAELICSRPNGQGVIMGITEA